MRCVFPWCWMQLLHLCCLCLRSLALCQHLEVPVLFPKTWIFSLSQEAKGRKWGRSSSLKTLSSPCTALKHLSCLRKVTHLRIELLNGSTLIQSGWGVLTADKQRCGNVGGPSWELVSSIMSSLVWMSWPSECCDSLRFEGRHFSPDNEYSGSSLHCFSAFF